jgi:acetyl-CoA carboxylase biotin carboxyl carrier protein
MSESDERNPVELTHDDVAAILDLIERSNVEYLEVEVGGTRIVADRSGSTVAARPAAAPPPPAAPPAPAAAPVAAPPAAAAPAAAPVAVPAAPSPAPAAVDASLVTVTAPMVGVLYRAPEPGAAAFVEVGSRIEAGATMGLVEVMKMFNSVTAPVGGEVVEVLAGNDEFVEFGQPLFRLRPAAA